MVSDTVIPIMFLKTTELPPIAEITEDTNPCINQNGGHEPEVHLYLRLCT